MGTDLKTFGEDALPVASLRSCAIWDPREADGLSCRRGRSAGAEGGIVPFVLDIEEVEQEFANGEGVAGNVRNCRA